MEPQSATLLLAVATFFGAMVGSLTQFIIKRKERKHEIEALRLAILQELEATPELDDEAWSQLFYLDNTEEMLPTQVFDANTEKIGLLTDDEVSDIVRFYSSLKMFQRLHEEGDGTSVSDDHGVWDTMSEYSEALEEQRETTINTIEENQSESMLDNLRLDEDSD